APTHWVSALSTWLYARPDFKSPPSLSLSINAIVRIVAMDAAFARLGDGRFVPTPHIAERDWHAPDFVAVAEGFLGVPYLWGGKLSWRALSLGRKDAGRGRLLWPPAARPPRIGLALPARQRYAASGAWRQCGDWR